MSRSALTSRLAAVVAVIALAVGLMVAADAPRAHAAGPSVLLVEAIGPSYVANVTAGLDATGQVGTVTSFDAGAGTPTATDFDGIDVAFVISDYPFADSEALGDVLADFVDAGGRVVESTFSLYCPEQGYGVSGRWVTDGYGAMVNPNPSCNQRDNDGPLGFTAVDATSPLLAGVTSFNGGTSSYRNDATVAPGAVLVANWDDEFPTPFEAYTSAHAGCVVALNFYPPSNDASSDFWDATTDGWVLQANALNYTCTATPPPPPPPPAPPTPEPEQAPAPALVITPRFTG
jgi:hypothetical protein